MAGQSVSARRVDVIRRPDRDRAAGCDPACDAALKNIFGPNLQAGAARLEATLEKLGVSTRATDHGIAARDWEALVDQALAGERGRNFIGRREALLAAMAA